MACYKHILSCFGNSVFRAQHSSKNLFSVFATDPRREAKMQVTSIGH